MLAMTTRFRSSSAARRSASRALSDQEAEGARAVFKALADRHRVKILNRLLAAGGEAVCVCEFEAMLGLKQSTVSYHLKQLLDAGIVSARSAARSPTSARPRRARARRRAARAMSHALFVCLHNAGRSQMSQALFERAAAGRHTAESAGRTPTRPGRSTPRLSR